MLLQETGFSFGGVHTFRDLGLMYAEKDGHPFLPRAEYNAYEIAGHNGSILFPGETWQTMVFEGTLYPWQERPNQREAQRLLRQVAAWLRRGRQQLIFDYEPQFYYLAEMSQESKWSLKNWFGGEINVKMEAQPYAYAVRPHQIALDTEEEDVRMTLMLRTLWPAPLHLMVCNQGEADISGVSIGEQAVLEGMGVRPGQRLAIDMEPPIGAEIRQADGGAENALPYARAFTPVQLKDGENRVSVHLRYSGEGRRQARLLLWARGRY